MKQLSGFLFQAKSIGLPDIDYESANELLKHGEYGLCFDTIVTQLYENDVKTGHDFYADCISLAKKMGINEEDYIFIKDLLE